MYGVNEQSGIGPWIGNRVAWRSDAARGLQAPIFSLPFSDAGSGVATIVPYVAAGSSTPTFTANSTRYTRLSSGLWGLVSANQPRSMYSAAGVYLGYWAEGARADVLGTTDAIRRDMSDAGWVVSNMTKGTTTGIDGTASAAATMTATAGNATVLFTTVLGAAVRTFSAWVSRVTGTGTVNITGDNGSTWTPIVLTATPTQFQFTTASAANPVVGFRVVTSGDAIKVDFNTLEQTTFANPTPIPVNVSKAADVLTFPAAGNISASVGSIYLELMMENNAGQMDMVDSNGTTIFYHSGDNFLSLFDGAERKGATFTVNSAVRKAATNYGDVTCKTFLDGTASSSLTFDGGLSIVSTLGFSRSGASIWGALKNVRIYGQKLPDSVLQAMTT